MLSNPVQGGGAARLPVGARRLRATAPDEGWLSMRRIHLRKLGRTGPGPAAHTQQAAGSHSDPQPERDAGTPAETRAERQAYLLRRYTVVEKQLQGRSYLFGDRFSVADAYLFTVTNWARMVKVDLGQLPNVLAFQERTAVRPAVQAAMRAEGLIK